MTTNIENTLFQLLGKGNTGKYSRKLSCKGKNGSKGRRTSNYFLGNHNKERLKQNKKIFDTHRREEQPDVEDQHLENIHFANFLRCDIAKDYEMVYNTNAPVNINMCDMFCTCESCVATKDIKAEDDVIEHICGEEVEEEREGGYTYPDYKSYYGKEEDDDYYYDEEEDRRENNYHLYYDSKSRTNRIWHFIPGHPKGGRHAFESDDDDRSC